MSVRRRFKQYPAYKDSGVEWLGEIPVGWEVKRLKFGAELNPSPLEARRLSQEAEVSFVPMEAVGEYGGLELSRTQLLADVGSGYTYFADGDVVVAKITPCFENGKGALAAGLTNGVAFGTTELHVLRALDAVDSKYLFYATLGDAFRRLGEAEMYGAGGQKRVPEAFVENLKHPLPPEPEQRAIAAFLDRETARIDALVAKKERLIELLQEKRTALITRAVTKGLDPTVPMKDSGVEWLGEIPAHWGTEENRWLFRESDSRSLLGEEELLTVSHITGVTRRSEKPDVTMIEAESHEGYKICEEGDLAINTMWAWMGALGIAPEHGMVSPSYNVFTIANATLAGAYYDYLCRMPLHVTEVIRHSKGIWQSRLRLYPDAFREIRTPLPPVHEQHTIAAFLDREAPRIDALIAKVHDAIERLKELRTALISAAVTGKIDVREEAA